MASPKISFRVAEETYKNLLRLAELERKTVAELSRELLEIGLGKRVSAEDKLLSEIQAAKEMAAKAVKLGGIATYYARLSSVFTAETMHYTTNNGQVMSEGKKTELQERWKAKSREWAMRHFEESLEEI